MGIFGAEAAAVGARLADTTEQGLVLLLLALPLAGFLITGAAGRRMGARPWVVAVLAALAAAAVATFLAFGALSGVYGGGIRFSLYTWIPAGDLEVTAGFLVDNLTAVLLIVVTWIGALVHVYSIGYMAHDPGRWRFFAYLNLFMFSMLLLVLASDLLVLFGAWELVGLSSYLLIGFWYTRRDPALASKKAFLVNRVADHSFLIGIIGLFLVTGTLDIAGAVAPFGEADPLVRNVLALLLFVGAAGKSAQFPFHVWLPDAMEGPTPVSALIHAATMVNAGVYFVARASGIFAQAPEALLIVAAVGIFTAILAATIALTQTDIKRVLAYSTLSQLGYMFAALGVGAFVAAIFHLMAHGFTKGLLFLGSGSVIHAVGGEQDMRRMGGLWRRIPITHWTFLIGALSLSGLPPLAGFFSKDAVLGESFILGYGWVFLVGLVVAGLTGFYMFRLMGLTFWGRSRMDPDVEAHVHESPPSMTLPLVLLAVPTLLLGVVIGLPLGDSVILHWLEPVFHGAEEALHISLPEYELFGIDGALILASVAVAALGIGVGIWLFGLFGLSGGRPETVRSLTQRGRLSRFLYAASARKWWFDDLNHLLFYRLGGLLARAVMWFDVRVVDGIVNGTARVTQGAGDRLRRIQTGRVQNYALGIALGLIAVALLFLWLVR